MDCISAHLRTGGEDDAAAPAVGNARGLRRDWSEWFMNIDTQTISSRRGRRIGVMRTPVVSKLLSNLSAHAGLESYVCFLGENNYLKPFPVCKNLSAIMTPP